MTSLPILPFVPQAAKVDDSRFFRQHPDRKLRIRNPYPNEYAGEFQSLGDHEKHRERIIVYRLPPDQARRYPGIDYARVGMLAFADEEIRDDDATLGPILDQIMREARGDA
jgi:hypothetical protein